MILMFGLTLMLKTAACLEINCRFNQSGPCAAALGDKLNLMMVDVREYDLKIRKINYNTQNDPVCKIKNDGIKKAECDLFTNRHDEVSVSDGILIIDTVIRADSGTYSLQVFNLQGTETFKANLQVIVEDPVVLPAVLGCLAAVLIILVIVAYYFYRKKNQLKPTANVSERVNEHVTQKKHHREEEQKRPAVQYATVDSQNKRKRKEEELHYGEVTFSSSSAQRSRQTQDECVYSVVQTR